MHKKDTPSSPFGKYAKYAHRLLAWGMDPWEVRWLVETERHEAAGLSPIEAAHQADVEGWERIGGRGGLVMAALYRLWWANLLEHGLTVDLMRCWYSQEPWTATILAQTLDHLERLEYVRALGPEHGFALRPNTDCPCPIAEPKARTTESNLGPLMALGGPAARKRPIWPDGVPVRPDPN